MIDKIKEKIMQDRRIGRSSLEAFLEILKEVECKCSECSKRSWYQKGYEDAKAEYGNGWIDVKDRLPEKDGYYLTCDHKGNIHVFYHHPSYVTNGSNMAFGICKNHPQFYKPIAWMELPNPYTRKKGV